MFTRILLGATLAGALWLIGCGKKTDLSFIDPPVFDNASEAYIPILPALDGFLNPTDVLAGYDELLYIVDAGDERIYAYDQSGRRLQSYHVPGVRAVAQDRRFDLLAIGTKDTLIGNQPLNLDAIYRIRTVLTDGRLLLDSASVSRTIIHPFYFKSIFSSGDTAVHLHDIAVLFDNSYYVSRSGPKNTPTQSGGPDNTVLQFDNKDNFLGAVSVTTSQGVFKDYFKQPFGLTAFAQPPRPGSLTINKTLGFVVGQLDPFLPLKVQYIRTQPSESGLDYVLNTDLVLGDTSRANGFLYQANKFSRPLGVTYRFGSTNYIIVADADKDSVYQFSESGLEGVSPPPTAKNRNKYINVSFGGKGTGPKQFNRPVAVAVDYNGTIYVCDQGNKRISRFRLTRDLE